MSSRLGKEDDNNVRTSPTKAGERHSKEERNVTTVACNTHLVEEATSHVHWDDDESLKTLELETEIPFGVRIVEDVDGKRLVDHFPTYESLTNFTPARFECEDEELVRLSTRFFGPILEIRKAFAKYEVEMSYWRYYFRKDGANFAAAEDVENKERLYQVLTSDANCKPGDRVYINVFY
jgi:hypothetical protein